MENKQTEVFLDEDVYKKILPEQKQHWVSFLMIFMGMWAAIPAMGVGIDVGLKLTPWKASIAFFLGYVICLIYGSFVGEIGRREGLSTTVLCERPFSRIGKILPSFITFLVAGVFIGVNTDVFVRIALSMLGFEFGEGFSLVRGLISVIACIIMMTTSYFGIKYMKAVSWIGVPIFFLVLFISFYFVVRDYSGSLQSILFMEANEMSFSAVMFLSVSLFAGFSALMGDVSRFVSTKDGLIKALTIGYLVSAVVPIWGVIVGAARGGGNYYDVFSGYGMIFSVLALIGLFFALWTTNDNNAFTSGLALSTISTTFHQMNKNIPRLRRKSATLVPIMIGIVLAFFGSGKVSILLEVTALLGAWLVPIAGILIGHYYIVEKNGEKIETTGVAGVSALVISGLLVQFNMLPIPAVTGILFSIILYVLIFQVVEKPLFMKNKGTTTTRID